MCRTSILTWLLLVVVGSTNSADPVYTPSTLSDASGNSADSDSQITWADLPAGTAYTAASPERTSAGLEPYYNLVHSFIGTVFSKGIPNDIIEKAANGQLGDVVSNYNQYTSYIIGYAICVAIGILFIIIFPIVGCCFCCCRCCCNNCGGRMYQAPEDAKNTCKKMTFAAILVVIIAFLLTGAVCIYVNNDNTSDAINSITKTTNQNLEDMKIYVNNSVEQVNHIVRNNFNFLKDAVYRDLDNVGYLVGLPLRTEIENQTGIRTTLSGAYAIDTSLKAADTALADVENKVSDLGTSINNLSTALTQSKTKIDNIFTSCGVTCSATKPNYNAQTGIDSSVLPDLTGARTSMNQTVSSNLTAKIIDAENELDSIPNTVDTNSNSTRQSLKTTIADLSDEIDPVVDEVKKIQDLIIGKNATIDLDNLRDEIDDAGDLIQKYDKYRWQGGVGLACLILLVIVLAALGLVFGVLGTCSYTEPHDRGFVANVGGVLLMASVGFVFIFSALLMLLTTLTFIIGAPTHAFICKPVTDLDTMEEIWTIYNDAKVGNGFYYMGDVILKNKTIALTLPGILRDCKAGKSALSSFKLDTKFNLDDLLNYSKTLDVEGEINAVNIDLSSVNVFPTSLQTQLTDAKTALDVDFSAFYAELNKDPTTLNLTKVAEDLDTYADSIPDPHKTSLKNESNNLRTIRDNEYADLITKVNALNTSVANLESAVGTLPAQITTLESGLTTTQNYIQNNASTAVKTFLTAYANRMLRIVDSFKDFTQTAIVEKLGSCLPVWNVYNGMMVYTFCYNIMDTFNGFWFSLGWCLFFFVPGIIFSVKLAKYFRRMTDNNRVSPSPDKKSSFPEDPVVSNGPRNFNLSQFSRTNPRVPQSYDDNW